MAELNSQAHRTCARLQQWIALSTLSDIEEFEEVVRTHRITLLKQGAVAGAAGINV
jgi:hypothetical protein